MSPPVLVTGGTGALGRAVLGALLDQGLDVRATWVVAAEQEAVSAELGDRGGLKLIEADLSSRQGADAAVAAAAPEGRLGGLVALVGGFASSGPLLEAPDDELGRMIELNLMITERTIRASLPPLLAAGEGSIVTVGARAAAQPFAGASGYIAAKAAVIALTAAVAEDYRADGIRANAIMPSVIDTPANRAAMPGADHARWVRPEAIAAVVRFLLSADSAPISGAAVPVYGDA